MRYLSVCSGIEAATVAWRGLGWHPIAFSEIEPFPCAVLAHHYPHVPNLGDMTKYHDWPAPCTCTICAAVSHGSFTIGGKTFQIYVCTICGGLSIDILCGGTPCQGFSISGLRGGLDDPRSQLSLTYVEIAARYRPRWLVWENVPGVLSSAGGRDFAAILGALTGRQISVPKDGWENSGVIEGIPDAYGIAWRVLDAQYCGVPQRRRRVFLVGYLGDWRRAAAVLFERHSLQGDPPPCRQAGKNVAPTISARTKGGGGLGTDFDCDGGLIAGTLTANGKAAGSATNQDVDSGLLIPIAFGGNNLSGPIDVATAVRAHGSPHLDFESETFVAHTTGAGFWKEGFGTLRAREQDSHENLVAHALTGEGFVASEDGTGRGTPIVPIGFNARQDPDNWEQRSGPLDTDGCTQAVAYNVHAANSNAMTGAGPTPAAFLTEVARCVDTHGFTENQGGTVIALPRMAVRRLTPVECDRLQGFPDNYTLILSKKARKLELDMQVYLAFHRPDLSAEEILRLSADGPRYKALGNSWAIPCVTWIGFRIVLVEGSLA